MPLNRVTHVVELMKLFELFRHAVSNVQVLVTDVVSPIVELGADAFHPGFLNQQGVADGAWSVVSHPTEDRQVSKSKVVVLAVNGVDHAKVFLDAMRHSGCFARVQREGMCSEALTTKVVQQRKDAWDAVHCHVVVTTPVLAKLDHLLDGQLHWVFFQETFRGFGWHCFRNEVVG
jgi:hypothetical protein